MRRVRNLRSAHAGQGANGQADRPAPWVGWGEDGQAILETAFSMMVVLTTAFWLFEFCMFTYTWSVLNEAAHQGLRYATMHGSNTGNNTSGCSGSSPAIDMVRTFAGYSLHDVSKMTANVCYPDATGSTPPSLVTMTVTYTYVPFVDLPGIRQTIKVVSQGRIVY